MSVSEKDWKIWRSLRELALVRFCDRVLTEVATTGSDTSLSSHERYRRIYQLMRERDKLLERCFDPQTRGYALGHILAMQAQNLLTEDELARFGPEIQELLARPRQITEETGHD